MLRAFLLVLVLVLATSDAHAEPTPEERAAAQALFEEGRALMTEQRYEEACLKLAESQRLDPGMGTQFNLADCYEQLGRLADAWVLFVDVAAAARAAALPEREAIARQRALLLAPRLTRLRIVVRAPVPGLELRRSGAVLMGSGAPGPHAVLLPRAQWASAIPLQPGRYRITASAPGYAGWSRELEVRGEGATVELSVPPLALLPAPLPEDPPEPPDDGIDLRIAAVAMGGSGLLAIGAGAVAGAVAISKNNESQQHCPLPDSCFDAGIELRDEARVAAAISTVGFVVGASALVGSAVLWLSAPDAAPVAVTAGPGGVSVLGRF